MWCDGIVCVCLACGVVSLGRNSIGDEGAAAIGASLLGAAAESKSAPWKIALATWLKRGSSVPNRWISEHLHMGPPDAVSRYVGEVTRGEPSRAEAGAILERLRAVDHKG